MSIRLCSIAPLAVVLFVACDETKMATPDSPAPSPESGETPAQDEKAEVPQADEAKPSSAAEEVAKLDEPPSTAAPGSTATPEPAAPTQKKGADQAAAGKAPAGPVVGKQATASASVKADEGYKCNDAFPHKFTAKGGANVDYPSPKVSGSCSGTKAISVSVPYVPTAAGPGRVEGELKYGICDDDKTNCRIMKKPVTVAFTAAPK